MEVQPCHAFQQVTAAVNGIAGKVVREEQFLHACVMLVPESNPVARKEVMEVQLYHAVAKFVPLDKSVNGKEVRPLQLCHVWEKLVPLDRSKSPGNSVSEEHSNQQVVKFVTPLKSSASNFGVTRSVLPRQ